MTVESRTARRSGCPISIALDLVGDRWSLLIVRDLMFKGQSTFNEFARSEERIATNILTDRLAKLETAGILSKQRDAADARRIQYRLTKKGVDLAPAMVEIVLWAARYEDTDAPACLLRTIRSNRERFIADIRKRCEAAAQSQ